MWLFVTNLGIAVGAGLYESRIVVPHWLETSPDSSNQWNAAAALALVDRLFTFSYFIPTMLTLMTDDTLSGANATRARFDGNN